MVLLLSSTVDKIHLNWTRFIKSKLNKLNKVNKLKY